MSKTLLSGAVGGIVGTVTAAFGIIWVFITYSFLTDMNNYLGQWSSYLIPIFEPGYGGLQPTSPPLYSPSWFSFSVSSFILAILLIVTGVLIGIGFYGIHKSGGGAMSVVGLIFSIIVIAGGALLIIMGNLTTGYMYANLMVEMQAVPFLPVPTPNFPLIWIGFFILGVAFILVGSASYSVRDMTDSPGASSAAGILSIIGAMFFILGGVWYVLLIVGFGLIFISFILWAVVFYSSRNM
ncbi:MAG: hypothetical protein WED07_13700 [Candidatus Freyarchaeum deiterrae]